MHEQDGNVSRLRRCNVSNEERNPWIAKHGEVAATYLGIGNGRPAEEEQRNENPHNGMLLGPAETKVQNAGEGRLL